MQYSTEVPFQFTGSGKDYFRIWIVNLFLSFLTLGIYSAWAKVRTQRYFYSHTILDGTCFEYVADPKQILIGRIIAVVLLAATYASQSFFPSLSFWFFIPIALVIPWMMLKSQQFRARNSVYRNIQFHFRGNYLEALLAFVVFPFLAGISLGLLSGFAMQKYYEFVVKSSGYGDTEFQFETTVGEYYQFVGLFILVLFGMILLYFVTAMAIGLTAAALFPQQTEHTVYAIMIPLTIIYVWQFAFIKAGTVNLMYSGLLIPGWYTFKTSLTTWGVFKLYAVNGALILLTLGLYIPFARIRMAQYRVDNLKLVSTKSLDEFEFSQDPSVNAVGQEVGDMFDFGVSL